MKRAGPRFEDVPLPCSLQTTMPEVSLRLLEGGDAPALFDLVANNARHLTRHGDYKVLVQSSQQDLVEELSRTTNPNWRFGIFFDAGLVGRADLIGVEPARFSIGYWLAEAHTGRGIATAALDALIDFARSNCDAAEIYAGVTHGNRASEALLVRLGFEPTDTFDSYTRFRLSLGHGMIDCVT